MTGPKGEHGLTPREREIMDRWDEGLSFDEIVADTGQTARRVRQTIAMYTEGNARRRFEDDARRGSAMLAAAIARVYGPPRGRLGAST